MNVSRIAIFVSFSGKGGVERMIVNLCGGLVALGCQVDLVLVKAKSEHLEGLAPEVRVLKLNASHTFTSLFELAGYLKKTRPDAILAAKDRAGKVAILARRLAGVPSRVVFRIGTTVSAALEGKNLFRRWAWFLPMRAIYPHADAVVAVSQGVADDLRHITGLPAEHFHVIHNPVITQSLCDMAREVISHPWFADPAIPVILGIGRLTRQKDFPTLLKAFALVRERRHCRLVILGEGNDRPVLEKLAEQLGVAQDVDFPGFIRNPYPYLGRASLFVLSSAWEGSPNALTEALALGVPVVATDCPSGPREILRGGEVAPLVPVGDALMLGEAMEEILAHPPGKERLIRAAEEFTVEKSSRRYLDLLLGKGA